MTYWIHIYTYLIQSGVTAVILDQTHTVPSEFEIRNDLLKTGETV
jgi:hypothetical protein